MPICILKNDKTGIISLRFSYSNIFQSNTLIDTQISVDY